MNNRWQDELRIEVIQVTENVVGMHLLELMNNWLIISELIC